MKKFFLCLLLSILVVFGAQKTSAMTFEEGIKQSKPMALYLYADWADNAAQGLQTFNLMGQRYSNKYNFITLNIASPEAKAFNKMYHIYPNLPYVLLFRDGTKFSRFLNMDCVMSDSCFSGKLDVFVN